MKTLYLNLAKRISHMFRFILMSDIIHIARMLICHFQLDVSALFSEDGWKGSRVWNSYAYPLRGNRPSQQVKVLSYLSVLLRLIL